jgi:hypothetical protein
MKTKQELNYKNTDVACYNFKTKLKVLCFDN